MRTTNPDVAILGFTPRAAVPMNLVISLITLATALVGRSVSLSLGSVVPLWPEILGLVVGGTVSALWGAGALKLLFDHRLSRLLAALLVAIGLLLVLEAFFPNQQEALVSAEFLPRILMAVVFGLVIGAVAALLGVAGGELLIPTFIVLFGADITAAGTASILVSLVLVPSALWRYVRLGMLPDRRGIATMAVPMGGGSMVGAAAGGLAVGLVAPWLLKLILGVVLIVASIRVFARRD